MERQGSASIKKILLKGVLPRRILVTPVSNVIRVKARADYVHIYTSKRQGSEIPYVRSHTTMQTILRELPKEFIRCHASHIVNINHIQSFTAYDIEMSDGSIIPMGYSFGTSFQNLVSSFYPVFNKVKGPV